MSKCQWCGNEHETKCPLVKALEYYDDGVIKRIEFFSPADYAASYIHSYPNLTPPATAPAYTPYIYPYPQTTAGGVGGTGPRMTNIGS